METQAFTESVETMFNKLNEDQKKEIKETLKLIMDKAIYINEKYKGCINIVAASNLSEENEFHFDASIISGGSDEIFSYNLGMRLIKQSIIAVNTNIN